MEKKALGKGLHALLPEKKTLAWKVETHSDKDVQTLPLDQILPNPHQPRRNFEDRELEELAESLKEHGVLQPVLVRRKGDGLYELIAGERRYRAAQLAGLGRLPVIVRNSNDEKTLALALVENIQRENLHPMEEARAYSRLMGEFGLTQDQVAHSVGKERSSVANTVRLLALPTQVQQLVESGDLSLGHGKVLAGLNTAQAQIQFANMVLAKNLSVRQLEQVVAGKKKSPGNSSKKASDRPFTDLEDRFRKQLGTKVQVKTGAKGGQLIIQFYSNEDLDRLTSIILE